MPCRKKSQGFLQMDIRLSHYFRLILSVCLLSSTAVFAETPEEKGLAIAVESNSRDLGWGDSVAKMTMTLLNKQGESSERKITIKNLEVDGDGDKSLTIFHEPKDVKGTSFLSFSHAQNLMNNGSFCLH